MPKIAAPSVPLDDQPDAMTPEEAAPYMRITGRHLRRLIAAGEFEHLLVQIGSKQRISREQLRRFLAGEKAA